MGGHHFLLCQHTKKKRHSRVICYPWSRGIKGVSCLSFIFPLTFVSILCIAMCRAVSVLQHVPQFSAKVRHTLCKSGLTKLVLIALSRDVRHVLLHLIVNLFMLKMCITITAMQCNAMCSSVMSEAPTCSMRSCVTFAKGFLADIHTFVTFFAHPPGRRPKKNHLRSK